MVITGHGLKVFGKWLAGFPAMLAFLFFLHVAVANEFVTPGYLFNSDPVCRVIDGRFYLFVSHDQSTEFFRKGTYMTMFDYHALSTVDFKNWVDHGSILNRHDAPWVSGRAGLSTLWDCDAGIQANGKFYGYFPYGDSIGVFESARPEGPYVDAIGTPLLTRNTPGLTASLNPVLLQSPCVVFDNKNQPYLCFGQGELYVARLNPNMTELAEPPVRCKVPSNYHSDPVIVNINGRYYMSYATGSNGKGYLKYCIAATPYGPYENEKILMSPWPEQETTHHGMAMFNGKWYMAYHMECPNTRSQHRHVLVTRLSLNSDGSFDSIDPLKDPGIAGTTPHMLRLDAFAWKREAEEFSERTDADEEQTIRGDYHFKMRNGGYLRFNKMDFGSGAAGCKIEVSCGNAGLRNAKVEFRLDSAEGQVIGECTVECTGGAMNYVTRSGPVRNAVGLHDVYIVAHGKGDDFAGYLFNINWFTFTRTYQAETEPMFSVNCGGQREDGLPADQKYTPGGWGYDGDTQAVGTRDRDIIYPTCNLPNALRTARSAVKDGKDFSYKFTVPNGTYRVLLYFAETELNDYGVRKFDVILNGKTVLPDFDIFLASGGGRCRGVKRAADGVQVRSGLLDVRFVSKVQKARVSAIKVIRVP